MLTITLRDLQFRRRQFAIAVVAAALVFGLTLLLTGMTAGFEHETRVTVRSVGGDAWVVPRGTAGPFTWDVTMPESTAASLERVPGVDEAAPLVEFGHRVHREDATVEPVNVIGRPSGGLRDAGTSAPGPGRAAVSDRLDVERGESILLGGRRLRVERIVDDASYFAGVPTVYVNLRDAQAVVFGGRRMASAVVTTGMPREDLPRGLVARTSDEIENDLLTPVENAQSTIAAVRLIMWLVAALIIGAVTYLSALERVRDFAVLKAVGGSSRTLALSLTAQAVLAALLAAVLAIGLERLMRPAVTIPVVGELSAVVLLLVVAAVVGVLSSLAALRRALSVDPALAFAG